MSDRKLGRGLDILIPRKLDKTKGNHELLSLSPNEITPNPFQPRKTFGKEELEELALSIKREGLLQPVLVRMTSKGYELISGERRLRASKIAKRKTIPAILVEADDRKTHELALIENLQRQDLNALEESQGLKNLIDIHGLTQEELAEALGKKRSTIANSLRLLDLPKKIQNALINNLISPGHAKVLLSLRENNKQEVAFKKIRKEKMSVRALEDWIEAERGETCVKNQRPKTKNKIQQKPPNLRNIEDELTRMLGTKVTISSSGEKGIINIHFYSLEDFDRIRALFRIEQMV